MDKNKMYTIICACIGATITWYINHKMGYGAIVANGLIGVLAAILLPAPLAAATYIASFVGMSGLAVLSSPIAAAIGGIINGIVLVFSTEIYAGVGGKGGTTAAMSVQVTRAIMNFFA
ncbi:hypothetical protein [Clostridium formicaceticum]|uniref:Uncharacterized protein n=1 Tax=Clostridium formicaceticum TaxID=1497 RepID=A0AAC9WHR7_9CLOT|nr:hypothetical protein [Clostridium formicaceticum]AOY74854.1 hypothetical protein BJL90_02100 [Clostridium formicaceticum]ARE89251.1 hypothetical protein CLFO_36580 [Clostridium formicaceticum]